MDTLEMVFLRLEDSAPSLEDGQVQKEIEYEIYGKMVNLTDLDKADGKERQEQWGIFCPKTDKNYSAGTTRVRKTDDTLYELAVKVKLLSDETEMVTTQDMFNSFKKLCESGMIKVRHFFPVVGTEFVYEVDAFITPTGQFCPWVKIDLELPQGVESIDSLPDLPFEMTDVRIIAPGPKKPDDLAFVRHLFDTYFNVPNEYLAGAPIEPATEALLSKSAQLVLMAEQKRALQHA